MRFLPFVLSAIVIYFGVRAFAQVEASTAILVRPKSDVVEAETAPEINLDSGRYQIKAEASTKGEPSSVSPIARKNESSDRKPVAAKAIIIPIEEIKSGAAAGVTQSNGKNTTQANGNQNGDKGGDQSAHQIESSSPNLVQQVQHIFIGDHEQIEKYRESLSADDTRQNTIDFSFAPTLFYTDSSSSYWFRDFVSHGAGALVDLKFWSNPFFGLSISYATTLAADIKAEPNSTRKISAEHSLFDVGLRFRKFFNMTRKSPVITFGVDYDEQQMSISKKEDDRIGLKTSGAQLVFEAEIPTTHVQSWVIGTQIGISPKVEETKTAVRVKSGRSPATQSLQIYFGQDFTFSRHQTLFWRLNHRYDKSIYEGTASVNDPRTSAAPEGVGVTQGTTLFSLGFSWGR